jgi:hypothetical protein
MPTAHLEDLSNDDLLVQLNAFCEEVAERLVEYESAEDRDTLAEAVSFVSAVERAVECRTGSQSCLDGLWWTKKRLEDRAADARLASPAEEDAFGGFLDEHPELTDKTGPDELGEQTA